MQILKQNNSNVWFIVALREEFYNKDANIIYTGVGKVNAALATQYLLDHYQVDKLINVGTAGAKKSMKVGGIYECVRFTQRDIWTSDVTRQEVTIILPSRSLFSKCMTEYKHIEDTCTAIGTGDTFCENIKSASYNLVDMESFAIAYTCRENKVLDRFYCLKYVSDTGDSSDWETNLKKCNKAFNRLFKTKRN